MLGAWFIRWLRARLHGDGSCRRAPIRSRRPRFETIERRDLLTTISLAPVADNTLFEAPLGNSDGVGPDIFAGETISDGARRALLRFDVAGSLPAGAHIDSATLQLHVSKDRSSNFSLSVHSLQASWGEGASNAPEPGGRGVPALANDATWTDRFFGTTQKWATSGGDFNAAASATVAAAVTIGGQLFYKWSGDQLAADVQSWLSTPSTQFGWLIKATSESTPGSAQRFDSREGLTPPQLTINYSLPNLAPTLDPIADQTILEGAAVQNINLTNITAGLGETQSLMVTATSDNPTLIATPGVNYTSPNSSGSLSYTPAADRFGSAKVTVTVRDAGADGIFNNSDDATFSQNFTVNVTPVNDQPTLAAISDPNPILEDAQLQSVNLSGISAGPFETQTITISAISSNPGLVPNLTVNYSSPDSTGSLTFQPVANHSGQAVITVTVKDDGGTLNSGVDKIVRTFTINVTAVNDPPTLNAVPNPPAILEDAAEQSIELTGISAGPLESGQALMITPTSSNPGLIANFTINYNQGDSTATLKYTPEPNQSGVATITVKVKDDGGTANSGADAITRSFTINVTSVNDPPTIDSIADPAPISENSGQQAVQVTGISAGPSETQVISISAKSDNASLIPDPTVDYTSPFIAGSLTYTPAPHRSGVANITVTVKDNGGTAIGGIDTTTRTFTIFVNEINDPPTLDAIPDPQGIALNSGEQEIQLTGIFAGPFESQFLVISASSNNTSLIPSVAVDYSSPNSAGSLAYTPSTGQTGSAVITVTVRDVGPDSVLNTADDATSERTFTVRVLSPDEINHAPSFVLGILQPVSDQTGTVQPVTDETGPMSQPNFAMQISPGPPGESQQAVSFILTVPVEQRSLFSAQPAVDTTGKLRFIPAPNAHGTAHITIQAKDDGGTALGGVDTSPQQFFDITIIKPHVWHNTRNDRDVDDDHFVVAQDVITIINRINAKGSGKIPDDATFGPPYYDVDNDGSVVAQDVLNIINFINAGHGGAEEAPSIGPAAADAVFQSIGDNLLALTLTDTADSTFLSRRK